MYSLKIVDGECGSSTLYTMDGVTTGANCAINKPHLWADQCAQGELSKKYGAFNVADMSSYIQDDTFKGLLLQGNSIMLLANDGSAIVSTIAAVSLQNDC